MAELVDALVSGTSVSNGVQVRVLFWAQFILLFFKIPNTKLRSLWLKSSFGKTRRSEPFK
jgi:hypothetical protein